MALPILDELKQELDRVYAAGSGLAKGDPRLLKYLPALTAMGRKAPVFNTMAEKLKALCEEDNTADNLLDLGNILYSVLYTQCSSPDTTAWREPSFVENSLPETKLNAAVLERLASDLEKKLANYMNISVLESLQSKGLHTDPRLFKAYCKAINGDKSNMEEFLEEKLFPTLGPAFDAFLEDEVPRALGKRLLKIKDIIERRKQRRRWI
ncbi:MAG: hypothetical protein LBT59_06705 [Clostridiales bacterium]|jgi:hypothetical protein|nr:hypothetical protein [Clostridiales bacterium]